MSASPRAARPLCFVLMPLGTKPDGTGREIDLDEVYARFVRPAIADAQLEPVRAAALPKRTR